MRLFVRAILALCLYSGLISAAPTPTRRLAKRLDAGAPLASDIGGAHLLIKDLAQSDPIIKNAYLLLSKPRGYYDGMSACSAMGEGGYIYIADTSGAKDLVDLLKSNTPANIEASNHTQFWVYNGVPGVLQNCLALNKDTGKTDWIPCTTQLPTVCFNSVMRRVLLFDDRSRQIKVTTPVGQIQGWRDQNAFRFLGIPYAEAPVGERRFAKPVAKAPFTSTYDALNYRYICPQTQNAFMPLLMSWLENGATEHEDCLNLNVYTPSLKGPGVSGLPVIMYIHGGGFTTYAGSTILFEPGHLVARGGVVVVTINYRLGFLGWLENAGAWGRSSVSGNQAIHDQILALQWIKKNIAAFGGDPNRITVMGESAGAVSIRAMLSAKSTWGLYQSVISQSDPANIPFKTPANAAQEATYFMQALGCPVPDLNCARSTPVEEVLNAQTNASARVLAYNKWTTWALVFRPVIDGDLIPAEFSQLVKTGSYNTKANVMWGTTKDEAGLFVPQYFPDPIPIQNVSVALDLVFEPERGAQLLGSPYFQPDPADSDAVRNLFNRAGTQYYFFCPIRYLSRQMSTHKPTYNYRFNRGRDIPLVGGNYCSTSTGRVCHSYDIQPEFGSGDAVVGFSQTGDDARFARQMIDRITTFAKTGNPNPQPGQVGVESLNPDVAGVNWPPYSNSNPIAEFNLDSSVSTNAENDVCSWIDTTFLYDFWYRMPGNTP
ncbi:hypothetical protein BGW42_001325 [Actinomortierella wolfii]|nr:hypothetical protein BGW42_001325 [Actinomortierella wolfii]